MDTWELDFEWLRVQHIVQKVFHRDQLPDLNAVLFLIGIQELGRWKEKFSKEEKQDLMHIAICRLLSTDGFYAFVGRDADGWPHYKQLKSIKIDGVEHQEKMLKEKAIQYFKELEAENGGLEEE